MSIDLPRPAYRSYSQLETWSTCGEKWRLSYQVRIPEEPAVWLVGGTAFHTVAEQVMRGEDVNVDLAWASAWNAAYLDVLERNPDANPDMSTWRRAGRVSKDKPNKEDHTWWQQAGRQMVRDFLTWREGPGRNLTVLDHGGELLLETQLMPLLGGIVVKAFPDAVVVDEHGQACVLDYKTGSRTPNNGGLQLGVYKAALMELIGVEPVWGLYYMARQGGLAEPKNLAHWTPARVGSLFATFDAQEKRGEYLPKLGDHCGFCSYKANCVYVGGTRHPDDPQREDA